MVRETIQNALDARKDPEKPIEVEFKEFSMLVEDFPGRSSFSKSIHACLDDNEDEDARKFFQQAVNKIDARYVLQLDASNYDESFLKIMGISEKSFEGIAAIDDNTPGFKVVLAEGNMRLYEIER